MRLDKKILATAAVVLPLSAGIGSALAYFTANTTAAGGYEVEVGAPSTDITETFGDWTKHVSVTNTGEVPVYVRVRAFSGSQYTLSYDGSGWTLKNGYYEYDTVLEVGATTSGLDIKIEGVPQDAADKDTFNVVVIYERTPAVQYNKDGSMKLDENGKPLPDWSYSVRQESEFPTDTGNVTQPEEPGTPETPEIPETPTDPVNPDPDQTEGGDKS